MYIDFRREFAAAAALTVFGVLFAAFAALFLPLGSFASMGPGMFPIIVGLLIFILGVAHGAVTFLAYRRAIDPGEGNSEPIQWHSLVVVVSAMAGFSTVIKFFGLIPAIIVLTAIASLGSEKLTIRHAFLIAIGLVLLAWLVFVWALGLPFTLIDWPF
ncbi:MAG: tripartite tricarboxylate transporter TctB family protein [Rhizobiaceae bacterium]|nr:tripartite tricarboxylate transporter TctB family protein [Rhizobiaceae bacterium]